LSFPPASPPGESGLLQIVAGAALTVAEEIQSRRSIRKKNEEQRKGERYEKKGTRRRKRKMKEERKRCRKYSSFKKVRKYATPRVPHNEYLCGPSEKPLGQIRSNGRAMATGWNVSGPSPQAVLQLIPVVGFCGAAGLPE